jgi:hypothetical protein
MYNIWSNLATNRNFGDMAKSKKTKKNRADKYDEKLAIKGSFKEVFKVVKKNKEDNLTRPKKDSY